VVLITVFQVGVLFFQCFEVITGALEFFFDPLHTLLQLLHVVPLVISAVLHANGGGGGAVVTTPHSIVPGRR